LQAPRGRGTRPILDRVKQALFDRLGAMLDLPGRLPPLAVLDLYAGSGGLGIEALSRGARCCCFVERDRAALSCLRKNLAALELNEERAVVVAGAAESVLIPPPLGNQSHASHRDKPDVSACYRLIFLDPPYSLSDGIALGSPLWRTIDRLASDTPLADDVLMVWRFGQTTVPPSRLPGGWRISERHDYGSMSLAFLHRISS
jgi:16S rRNA (guanine966-N2)-methyltransferase